MERDVLHLQIPAFPIALARVRNSSLRGRPIAVAPAHSDRALLQCVSAEAATEGVYEGMPIYRARRLCPSLTLLPPDPELLGKGARSLLEVAGAYSPVTEPSAAGRLFLDLTGCRRLLGPGRDAAARLEKEIAARLRLQGTVGVAGNKLVSRIAAGYLGKPGVCDVLRGSERTFIAPLPVAVLPGIGAAREAILLRDLNLRRVEEVAALSVPQLRLAFGPFAPLLHQRACGIDPSPVQPPRRTPEIVAESFPTTEENDDRLLLAELCRLTEECGLRLRRLGKQSGRLTLTLSYADGVDEGNASILPFPLCHDLPLLAAVEDLFYRTCRRRVRLKGMRLVCDRLVSGNRQMDLFSPQGEPTTQQAALQEALDKLRTTYGRDAVRWGSSL